MANHGFNSTTYDQADRLTAWNRTDGNLDQAWDLSLVGDWDTFTENLVQELRTHTAVHEIATIDAISVVHDATGNLTRNASDALDRYTWDFDNRLATADVDQDGTAECGYQYDARGKRVSKTVPDGEGGSATTVFVSDGNQVVAEYTTDALATSPERKFVYATYIDEPVMMVDETALGSTGAGSEEPYYYHQNSLYSVAAITDATATVVERYAYSAYGEPRFLDANASLLDPQATAIGNPYLFTGRRLDQETGLYYYRARMYDAELGRFVGRDPIGYDAGDVSLYAYCGNDPVARLDPTGKWYYVNGAGQYCGPYVKLYTGSRCVAPNVWDAAMGAAGGAVTRTWKCYITCMVDLHTCPECLIGGGTAGQINITLSHLPVPKPSDLRATGGIWTTMNRILQVRLHDMGCTRTAARLGNLQARVNQAPVRTAAGRIVGGILITESLFSITCSTVCMVANLR